MNCIRWLLIWIFILFIGICILVNDELEILKIIGVFGVAVSVIGILFEVVGSKEDDL